MDWTMTISDGLHIYCSPTGYIVREMYEATPYGDYDLVNPDGYSVAVGTAEDLKTYAIWHQRYQ